MNQKTLPLRLIGAAAVSAALALPAAAADYTLKVQTLFSSESTPGLVIQQFVDDVETMSNGRVEFQMHYSSEVVAQNEVQGAATQGILDCYMSGSGSPGKDPAFQFAGDIMGGYDTPYQFQAWLHHGGGYPVVQEVYGKYDLHVIGFLIQGHESLSSINPVAGFADLKDWKFRSPPGLETEIFAAFGAKPVVMDFGEIASALRTGVVDGADASTLETNHSLGFFDIVSHATFPGFHSMPADHFTCNKKVWESLPADIQRMLEVGIHRASLDLAMLTEIKDKEIAVELVEQGITLHDWAVADRKQFRDFARGRWEEWKAKSADAAKMVDSHVAFMKKIGLVD